MIQENCSAHQRTIYRPRFVLNWEDKSRNQLPCLFSRVCDCCAQNKDVRQFFFFCTKEKLKWTILVRGMTWCDDAKQGLEENRDYCSSPAKRKTILLLLTKVWRVCLLLLTKVWRVSSVLWKGKCHRPLQRRGVAEISVPEDSVANHGHLLSVTIRVFVIGTALQNNFSVEAGIHTSVVVDQKLHDTLYFVCHYFITTQTNRGKEAVKTIKIWTCNPSDMYG